LSGRISRIEQAISKLRAQVSDIEQVLGPKPFDFGKHIELLHKKINPFSPTLLDEVEEIKRRVRELENAVLELRRR
jgi:hypothetical protein